MPGEQSAKKQLKRFILKYLSEYPEARDRPDLTATSFLSAHLHFGELSPRQVLWQVQADDGDTTSGQIRSKEVFLKELMWREFANYILFNNPRLPTHPLNERYREMPYSNNRKILKAWQSGHTGYPLVDAGMRELWATGFMHNRVRMVVASFLCKNGQISWQHGQQWFWDTLVDADLANNAFNWQWVAGCGADAAPYFRIFNPVTQSKKFDPDARYIKKWIPELAKLPIKYAHEPWNTPVTVQRQVQCLIGEHYPRPVLDLAETRTRALDLYNAVIRI